ncbi:MAG: hypothetical protein EXQ87_03230 [Alphaproteobacteria bacterium]|nr:hypothetical protein [Alphaproteobacteria bacterium]
MRIVVVLALVSLLAGCYGHGHGYGGGYGAPIYAPHRNWQGGGHHGGYTRSNRYDGSHDFWRGRGRD